MYLYIIFSSLISSLWIGLFGKYLGRQAAVYSSLLTLLISLFFAVIILQEILLNKNIVVINLYNLFIITKLCL